MPNQSTCGFEHFLGFSEHSVEFILRHLGPMLMQRIVHVRTDAHLL